MNRDKEQGKTPNMGLPCSFFTMSTRKMFLGKQIFVDKCRLPCIIHIKAMLLYRDNTVHK